MEIISLKHIHTGFPEPLLLTRLQQAEPKPSGTETGKRSADFLSISLHELCNRRGKDIKSFVRERGSDEDTTAREVCEQMCVYLKMELSVSQVV